jgi:hypothetical protein
MGTHTEEQHVVEVQHDLRWEDRPEQIWVVARVGDGDAVHYAYTTEDQAEGTINNGDLPWGAEVVEVTLHRPSLIPTYGGSTLLEALWVEMDRLMEALMTDADAEDGGDKYRAQELAWVLAVVSNPYDPSVDRVRAEAMDRWNQQQEAS